ncbi:MAG: methyltransferase domain-containing protein [Rhodanobacteraceae bacterium]
MNAALDWDYTTLAEHYRHRGPYADDALRELFRQMAQPRGARAVDIGAGTGRFTAALADEGFDVAAVEPNPAMRAIGRATVPNARWIAARGEATGLDSRVHDIVSFGSSFNVLPAAASLAESARLLVDGGWLACLWNHRDLDDALQAELQAIVEREVPGYSHGSRRDDPCAAIVADGRFEEPVRIEGATLHEIRCADFVEGFRAHATLARQAGAALPRVLDALGARLADRERIAVPFVTRIFAARRLSR